MKACRSETKSRRDKWLELQAEKAGLAAAFLRGPEMYSLWRAAHRYEDIEKKQARIEREARKAGEQWLECRGW